jgi:glycine/D-amino acid oxidase-like deaminating enzyme
MLDMNAMLQEIPYWLDPPPLAKSFHKIPLPDKIDVLIVGGGYTGITAAIRLRQNGAEVTVIDREQLGSAASARNGGMTLTGLSESLLSVLKKLGEEKARQFFAESLESVNCVERLVREGNIDCDFKRHGHIVAAYKPAHFEMLMREQEFLGTRFDHLTRLIQPSEMRSEIGSDRYHGALIDPQSAGLHPAKYIAGLIKMADQLGVDLHAEVAAEHIKFQDGQFLITTNQGPLTAIQVVIATNGYTGNLVPWLQRRIFPVESLMIATAELPEDLALELVPNDRMIYDTKRMLYYFRLSPDQKRILFGGRPKSSRIAIGENADFMRQHMLWVYPQLCNCKIEYVWSGKVGFTMDRFPHIGRKDGIYYALGYCGHGVALATYLGEKLAEMILGNGINTAFAYRKFKALPFYTGNPWFTPLLNCYFSMLDRIR